MQPTLPQPNKFNRFSHILTRYLPALIPVALIVLNALIDNGSLTLAPHTLSLVNSLLAALGLGALHVRTK